MTRHLLALAALATTTFAAPALATVDGWILYNVPYASAQTDDICFMRVPMLASFGIPSGSLAIASLSPTSVRKESPTPSFFNHNLAAPAKLMVHTYVSDNITNTGTWEYSMKLDVRALAAHNGHHERAQGHDPRRQARAAGHRPQHGRPLQRQLPPEHLVPRSPLADRAPWHCAECHDAFPLHLDQPAAARLRSRAHQRRGELPRLRVTRAARERQGAGDTAVPRA